MAREKCLDLGCGASRYMGFWGVDARQFPGVDQVVDLVAKTPQGDFFQWPWVSNSIEMARASHFVEHLEADERIHFVNELYRILQPGGKAFIIVPHWGSQRAYGDLTHKWPPVSEFWFNYLGKAWREQRTPHCDFYACDFEVTYILVPNDDFPIRNNTAKAHAALWYRDGALDISATFYKPDGRPARGVAIEEVNPAPATVEGPAGANSLRAV